MGSPAHRTSVPVVWALQSGLQQGDVSKQQNNCPQSPPLWLFAPLEEDQSCQHV